MKANMVNEEAKLCIEVGYPGTINGDNVPKRLSAKAIAICEAEWSWSPAHSRYDEYALHSGRKDWFLWVSFYDDFHGKIDRNIIGRMPKKGLDSENAATSLLKAFWYFDKNECDTDRPHRCNAAALSDEALEGIMGAVWEGE